MNKERMIWMLLLILSVMYIDRKEAKIDSLEILDKNNQLTSKVQSDQIADMLLDYESLSRSEYNKGFEDGKAHALVSVIYEQEINSYADGYHSALSQFIEKGAMKDLAEKLVRTSKKD
jgi:hypothetical protein